MSFTKPRRRIQRFGKYTSKIKAKMNELNPYIEVDEWYKVYDEAAAWFATELMGQFGDYFMPTAKHLNKKENGLSLCKDQIIYETLVMTDRMQKLKWEIQQYVRTDRGDIPKKNDHLIDCWRYLNAAANYDMNEVIEKKIVKKQKIENGEEEMM